MSTSAPRPSDRIAVTEPVHQQVFADFIQRHAVDVGNLAGGLLLLPGDRRHPILFPRRDHLVEEEGMITRFCARMKCMSRAFSSRIWGMLLANPSSTTINFRCGCSWRICRSNRLAAFRSQSFLSLPSCFSIGSGARGITSRWLGCAGTGRQHLVLIRDFAGLLVHLFQAGVAVDGGGGKISGAVQGQQVAFLVENERLQGLPALHLAKDRVEQRANFRGSTESRISRICVSEGMRTIRNRLRMFSSLRRSSKASKEGSFRENMANADMSVSGNEIGLFRVRGSETFSHSPRNSV